MENARDHLSLAFLYFLRVNIWYNRCNKSGGGLDMNVIKTAIAGSLESNDALITIIPIEEKEIRIEVQSIVDAQFGDKIRSVVIDTLNRLGVENVFIKVQDRGALDCVLEARIETAVLRGGMS